MQRILSIALALSSILAALALAVPSSADETIYEKRTYEEQRHSLEIAPPAPAVRERTVIETVPAPPVVEKRTTETIVSDGDDKKVKVEVEHDDDNDDD